MNKWRHNGERLREPLHYTACGLDDVYLVSGYHIEETPYGSGISVTDVDALHLAIGRHLVTSKKLLSGKEIRFLRHQMDLTQSELARLFGCTSQQTARYEKGECEIPGPSDRLLRLLFKEHMKQTFSVRDILSAIDEMDAHRDDKMYFESVSAGWKQRAHA